MNFFNHNINLFQAEQQAENYILEHASSDFYLKDIPLSADDKEYIKYRVSEHLRHTYSIEGCIDIPLLFVLYGYILCQTIDTRNEIVRVFISNSSHIPQHHIRQLVYHIVSLFIEFDICTFGITCTTLEDVINVIQKHSDM